MTNTDNGEGGWFEQNDTFTVRQASPGYWRVFNPHGLTVNTTAKLSGSNADAVELSTLSGTSTDSQFVPENTELVITVSGIDNDEAVFVGRESAIKPIDLHRVTQSN